ncbi:MAG: YigZ family protein [Bacteroidota bacterium]
MTDTYFTIRESSKGIYKEKGSKFLAHAFPVKSEEEIKDLLAGLRKEYHDARHHCYAYRLGYENHLFRINDDGEPSGTAGRPIYGQILSKELTQILIVVIRYFGGIKLGVPGLINAYKCATNDALEQAEIMAATVREKYRITFNYAAMNSVMKALKEGNAHITSHDSGNECSIEFLIRKNEGKNISLKLENISTISIALLGEI